MPADRRLPFRAMHVPQRLTALAIAGLLAAPGTALAQSAGDNQYQDPFGSQGNGGGQSGGSQGSGGGSGQSSGDQSSGSQSSSGQSSSGQSSDGGSSVSSSTGTTDAQSSQTTSSRELPRTGGEPGLVALMGAALTLGGVALRRRIRRPAA
jgi:LPXTG-motif cell wall-anchored protein